MKKTPLLGVGLLTASVALFGAVIYEPANLVSWLGLQDLASEAVVVLFSLVLVGAGSAGGVAVLRLRSKAVPAR